MLVKDIWYRLVCMLVMTMRYEIEARHISDCVYQDDPLLFMKLNQTINDDHNIFNRMASSERQLLRLKPGAWSENQYPQYSWYVEGMGTLLWALNELKDFAPHDEAFSYKRIDHYFEQLGPVGIPGMVSALSKKDVDLRPESVLKYQWKRAEIVYKRCVMAFKFRNGEIKMPKKKYSDLFPMQGYDLPVGQSGDLMVNGKEFCDIPIKEEGNLCSMSLMRLQTLSWLFDTNVEWDHIHIEGLEELPV